MTAHTLPHTFATYAIANGMSGKGLQHCLGHTHLEASINVYVDSDVEFAANDMMRHTKNGLDNAKQADVYYTVYLYELCHLLCHFFKSMERYVKICKVTSIYSAFSQMF